MIALFWDVRHSARGLFRERTLALGIVACIGLGVGANATMFAVVDHLVLRPPAEVREPDRLRRLYYVRREPGGGAVTTGQTSYPIFRAVREVDDVFDGVVAYTTGTLSAGAGEGAKAVRVAAVSTEYFYTLGARPVAGRFFGADSPRSELEANEVVVSHTYWRSALSADPRAVGSVIRIGSAPFTVVGIAPARFRGVDVSAIDMWVPLGILATKLVGGGWRDNARSVWLHTVVRLKSGVSAEAATARVARLTEDGKLGDSSPFAATSSVKREIFVGPLTADRGPTRSSSATMALWLFGVSGVVVLVACVNAATLMLVRVLRRRQELATRLAIGATTWQAVRLVLVDCIVVGIAAAVVAVLVAYLGDVAVGRRLVANYGLSDGLIDRRVLAVTGLVATGGVLLCGVVATITVLGVSLANVLRSEAVNVVRARSPYRTVVLTLQVAITSALLVGAGLITLSFAKLRTRDLGIETGRVVVVPLDLASYGYAPSRVAHLAESLEERVRARGIANVAVASAIPFASSYGVAAYVNGRRVRSLQTGTPYLNAVSPSYFRVLGTRLRYGRAFDETDRKGSRQVVIVDETTARVLWQVENPVGECIRLGDAWEPCAEVVGVVQSARRSSVLEDTTMQVFVPLAQNPFDHESRAVFVGADGAAPTTDALRALVRHELYALAPDLPWVRAYVLDELVEPQLRPWATGMAVLLAFGAAAYVVAVAGLYAAFAFAAESHAKEVALRLALGAPSGRAARIVIRHGMRVAVVGVVIGAVGAALAARRGASLLVDVSATDLRIYVAAGVLVLGAAFGAAAAVTRRVTRREIMAVLHSP